MRVPHIIVPAASNFRIYGKTLPNGNPNPDYGKLVATFQPAIFIDLLAEAPAHRWDLRIMAEGQTGAAASDWTLKLRHHTVLEHTSGPMHSRSVLEPFDVVATQRDFVEGIGWAAPGIGKTIPNPAYDPRQFTAPNTLNPNYDPRETVASSAPRSAGEFGVIARKSTSPSGGIGVQVSRTIRNSGRSKVEYDLEFTGGDGTSYLLIAFTLTPVFAF
ncbi:hypothetical protein HR12_20895 [Microbacterium sp. SUBG005]|nr:hypothetical protein HR12_20895 [Microbacterium sp. SUBG005]